MHQSKIIKQDVCREYRKKYPNMCTTALSRLIYNSDNNHLVWKNSENIRTTLRHIEGKTGDLNRKTMKDKSLFVGEARPMNPYKLNLPDSDAIDLPHYVLKGEKVGVLSDIHIPYHDREALECAILYLKAEKVDTLVILGDFCDFHGGSRFNKNPKARKMSDEISMLCDTLRIIKQELQCKLILHEGNHDIRFSLYANNKVAEMPQLSDLHELKSFTLENILRHRLDFAFDYVPNNQFFTFNGLILLHGNQISFGASSPTSPSKAALTKMKTSCLIGHHHQTGAFREKDAFGNFRVAYSMGCLCELSPDYMRINNHNHGFALLEKIGDSFRVHNLVIINGVIQ